MPVKTFQVSLAAVGAQRIVPNGNRITDVSILPDAAGNPFNLTVDLGNNQTIGPITQPCVIAIDRDVPFEDVSEGVAIVVAAAQAGVVVPVVVSYARGQAAGGVRVEPA